MRILVVNRFYRPDESATAMLATDMAEDLARAGHEVRVLCSRSLHVVRAPRDSPNAHSPSATGLRLPARESLGGVEVERLASTGAGRLSLAGRALDLATFSLALHARLATVPRPDVALFLSDPPMAALGGAWMHAWRGCAFVHHVMDLYPDVAVALAGESGARALAGRAAGALAGPLMNAALRRCDRAIALGETMADRLVARGVARDRIAIVPPWADGDALRPLDHEENEFRRGLGLAPGDVLFLYSGNLGRAHSFDAMLEGIERIAREDALAPSGSTRARFLFTGDGPRREAVARLAERLGGARPARGTHPLAIHPPVPRERLRELLASADVHLVSQDPRTVGMIVPSKPAGVFAVGRPAIFLGPREAEVARAIARADCGIALEADDVDGFVASIRALGVAPDASVRRAAMGARARRLFESEYDRRAATGRVARELELAVEARARRSIAPRARG